MHGVETLPDYMDETCILGPFTEAGARTAAQFKDMAKAHIADIVGLMVEELMGVVEESDAETSHLD